MRVTSLLLACALMGMVATAAMADPASFVVSFDGVGLSEAQYYPHDDAEPFKGWVTVNVTNTSTVAWGDFHFFLFSTGQDVSNVDFIDGMIDDVNYDPTSSQSGLTWVIDNTSVGAKIDLFYYGDPVLPGESATFQVYTWNHDQVNFGAAFYPSPVPEPATMGLLGVGLMALIARRRRAA